MADNYLEKKMEELRSGKLTASSRTVPARRHQLTYPYRELRVLIAGNSRTCLRQYADAFRDRRCRVAVFNTIHVSCTDLGDDNGTRYYILDGKAEVRSALSNLSKFWRDIDVVVLLDCLDGLKEALAEHTRRLPYPNDWGMPVLVPLDGSIVRRAEIPDTLSPVIPDTPRRPEASVLTWLALPSNANIQSITLLNQHP